MVPFFIFLSFSLFSPSVAEDLREVQKEMEGEVEGEEAEESEELRQAWKGYVAPEEPPISYMDKLLKDRTRRRWYVLTPTEKDVIPGLGMGLNCSYFGFQYSMEWEFWQTISINVVLKTETWEQADYILLGQCVSKKYFELRGAFKMEHYKAIEMAEQLYLVPLVRWAMSHPSYRKHAGKNFAMVYSMDLGRSDFPEASRLASDWSVGTLTGWPDWMNSSMVLASSFHPLSGTLPPNRCLHEDSIMLMAEHPRDAKPWDFVIAIPSRFDPEPRSFLTRTRTRMVFFAGSLNSCARKEIYARFHQENDHVFISDSIQGDAQYRELMFTSKYCLVLRGSSHTNNVRLYDVIMHGCVPVIVSDDFAPPLDVIIPWERTALFLPTSDIPHLLDILESTPEGIYEELHFNVVKFPHGAMFAFQWQRNIFWNGMLGTMANKIDEHLEASPSTFSTSIQRLKRQSHKMFMHKLGKLLGLVDPSELTRDRLGGASFGSDKFGCADSETLLPSLAVIYQKVRLRTLEFFDMYSDFGEEGEDLTRNWVFDSADGPLLLIDGGANIGKTSALFFRFFGDIPYRRFIDGKGAHISKFIVCPHETSPDFPNLHVISVEPNPENFQELLEMGRREGWEKEKWTPVKAGLSNFDDVALFQKSGLEIDEVGILLESEDEIKDADKVEKIEVLTLPSLLQTYSAASSKVFLLKLDVEGQEWKVLYGSDDLLRAKKVKFVVLEFSQSVWKKVTLGEVVDRYMWSFGYMCFLIMEGELFPLGGPFWDPTVEHVIWSNVFCGILDDPDLEEVYRMHSGTGKYRWRRGKRGRRSREDPFLEFLRLREEFSGEDLLF